jgi:hypothetical protein
MSFASRAKLAQLFYHFHNRQILSRGNLRTSKSILHDISAGIIEGIIFNMHFLSQYIYLFYQCMGRNIIDYLKQVPPPKTEKI